MFNRRIFFKHAGAFALGTLFLPACNVGSERQKESSGAAESDSEKAGQALGAIGIQIYSVKDILEQDLRGVLQQLADMGYKEIESYPGSQGHYYGMEPKAFAEMLSELGLTLVSSHFGSGSSTHNAESWHQATMLSRFDELVENAAKTGQKYLTCSWMDQSLRNTPEDLAKTAELFNQVGEKCKQAGMTFAYHNHSFEFDKVGDHVLYDFILENTDPELVKYEMDIYWLVAAGKDPLAYFEKYPNRFPLGHVKDMDKQDSQKNSVIGKGAIDYPTILKAARESGMKHFLVEQETFVQPSIEAMKENIDYLSALRI